MLLNEASGRWHVLNPTGALCWQEFSRTGDLDAVVAAVASRYQRSPWTVRHLWATPSPGWRIEGQAARQVRGTKRPHPPATMVCVRKDATYGQD